MEDEADRHPLIQGLATLTAVATVVFSLWCTVIAFVGGTMPVFHLQTQGSFGFGLLWLCILDPILVTVCYWITLLVLSPFIAGAAIKDGRRERAKS